MMAVFFRIEISAAGDALARAKRLAGFEELNAANAQTVQTTARFDERVVFRGSHAPAVVFLLNGDAVHRIRRGWGCGVRW